MALSFAAPGWVTRTRQSTRTSPFAGTLTLEQRYSSDQDVMDWIAQGPPPVYFGFGSMPLREPVQTLQMIRDVCASLDLRALVLSSDPAIQQTTGDRALKIVGVLNHARAFPSCRAVVHHGGSGTTAAGLRAGVPALRRGDAVRVDRFAGQDPEPEGRQGEVRGCSDIDVRC